MRALVKVLLVLGFLLGCQAEIRTSKRPDRPFYCLYEYTQEQSSGIYYRLGNAECFEYYGECVESRLVFLNTFGLAQGEGWSFEAYCDLQYYMVCFFNAGEGRESCWGSWYMCELESSLQSVGPSDCYLIQE
jgi:hypothetical protein